MALDLTPEMRTIGGFFQQELEQNIAKQKDLDGASFWPVMYSTAQARQRKSNAIQRAARTKGVKGRIPGTRAVRSTSGGVDQKRLLFTRRFYKGAFKFIPYREMVRVMTWPGTYPGENVSFRDIVRYNNRNDSICTNKRSPKIFPLNETEVRKMSAYKQAVAMLNSESTRRKVIGREYRKKITVQF